MDELSHLSKKERRELRRQERMKDQKRGERHASVRRIAKIALWIALAGAGVGGLGWYISRRPQTPPSEIISRNGLHWHAKLTIVINGKEEAIPPEIGLGAVHNPIHTHEEDRVIHMEFPGLVRRDDLALGQFFKVWKKDFSAQCIFEQCNGSEGAVKMLVNGHESAEFAQYQMKDNDEIEIMYK